MWEEACTAVAATALASAGTAVAASTTVAQASTALAADTASVELQEEAAEQHFAQQQCLHRTEFDRS